MWVSTHQVPASSKSAGQRFAAHDGGPLDDRVAVLLVIVVRTVQIGGRVHGDDLGVGGDHVARASQGAEVPVHVQEHASGTRKVLGDERVEQPGRDPALDDDPAETAGGCDVRVVVPSRLRSPVIAVNRTMSSASTSGARRGARRSWRRSPEHRPGDDVVMLIDAHGDRQFEVRLEARWATMWSATYAAASRPARPMKLELRKCWKRCPST